MAENTFNGEASILLNDQKKTLTPSAVAFKLPSNFTGPLNITTMRSASFRYGSNALRLVRKNPKVGFQYLPRAVGRKGTEFNTCEYANSTSMLSLLAEKLLKYKASEGVILSYPFYYTSSQILTFTNALRLAGVNVITSVDDITSMAVLYGAYHSDEIKKKWKHVMFIDIGAASVKVYTELFMYDDSNKKTMVNQTAESWSEKLGGLFFAREVSKKRNISVNQAEKNMIASGGHGYEEDLNEQLQELASLIDKVATLAKSVQNIDEIHLIGGASLYKFIPPVVASAVGIDKSLIYKDLGAYEAIVRGSILGALMMRPDYLYVPIGIEKHPTSNIYLECEDRHIFCQHGDHCTQFIKEISHGPGCDEVRFIVDENEIGEGVNPIISSFVFTNLSLVAPNSTIYFTTDIREPILKNVKWCISDQCQYVGFDGKISSDVLESDSTFMQHVSEAEKARREISKYALRIQNDAESVIKDLEKVRSGRADMFGTISKADEKTIRDALQKVLNGKINNMEVKAVKILADKVEIVKRNFQKANTRTTVKNDDFPDIIDPDKFSL